MTQQTSPSKIARIFDAELRDPAEQEALGPRYNVAPTQPLRVVLQRDEGRFVELHRWGLVPSWSKGPGQLGARLINARAETVARNPSFRASLLGRRCIVPSDGFYEWRREGRTRQPFLIRATDGRPLAFAGLWAPWRDPASGEWLLSATVVTTAADETVGRLHDRMPVILPPAAWLAWLDSQLSDPAFLEQLLGQPQVRPLELVAVSPRVNSPHHEGPELIEPYHAPAPSPTLFDGS